MGGPLPVRAYVPGPVGAGTCAEALPVCVCVANCVLSVWAASVGPEKGPLTGRKGAADRKGPPTRRQTPVEPLSQWRDWRWH